MDKKQKLIERNKNNVIENQSQLLDWLHKSQNGEASCRFVAQLVEEYIDSEIKKGEITPNINSMVVIPKKAPIDLLASMCVRYNHAFNAPNPFKNDEEIIAARKGSDFGLKLAANMALTDAEKNSLLGTMRQLHEEVTGTGFYKYKKL